jgi:hypothetical protein
MLGVEPVWAGPYATYKPAEQALHLGPDVPRTLRGWRIKVLWAVSPTLKANVAVRAGLLESRRPLWLEIEGQKPSTRPVLDPKHPGVPPVPGEARQFPSYLYFPRAACYFLEASWPGGRWRMVFGAGR